MAQDCLSRYDFSGRSGANLNTPERLTEFQRHKERLADMERVLESDRALRHFTTPRWFHSHQTYRYTF